MINLNISIVQQGKHEKSMDNSFFQKSEWDFILFHCKKVHLLPVTSIGGEKALFWFDKQENAEQWDGDFTNKK